MNRQNPKRQPRKKNGRYKGNNQNNWNGRPSSNHGGPRNGKRNFRPRSNGPSQIYSDIETPVESEKGKRFHGLDPFALFCACHLGIQDDNSYRAPKLQDAARMLGAPISSVKQALQIYDLDYDTIRSKGFELHLAKLDIQVAPEGISKLELAKELYKEYRDLAPMPELPLEPEPIEEPVTEESTKILNSDTKSAESSDDGSNGAETPKKTSTKSTRETSDRKESGSLPPRKPVTIG